MNRTQTFSIQGMHCTGCAASIDLDLEELTGIASVQTNYASQKTAVEYDSSIITEQEIIEQIKKTGYQATLDHQE
jgi:Cu+-exporting ATPase